MDGFRRQFSLCFGALKFVLKQIANQCLKKTSDDEVFLFGK